MRSKNRTKGPEWTQVFEVDYDKYSRPLLGYNASTYSENGSIPIEKKLLKQYSLLLEPN